MLQMTQKLVLRHLPVRPVCSSEVSQSLLTWLLSGYHKRSDQVKRSQLLVVHKEVDMVCIEMYSVAKVPIHGAFS